MPPCLLATLPPCHLVTFAFLGSKSATHQYILKEIWEQSYSDQTQYLRVFVAQLRKKIEEDANAQNLLLPNLELVIDLILLKNQLKITK